jgi:alpha-beta hydrolase superfamily lysophospholipase
VVIQAGSGPTNRYGNNPMGVKANSYKLIAESLAQRNIATLLMDKRGIAESAGAMKNEAALRFDDYADDLANWISFIKKDKRIKKVFIAGHSEGSLVGMLAAQKEKVNGYISIEGAGERIDRIIVWQYAQQHPKIAPLLILCSTG